MSHLPSTSRERKVIWLFILLLAISCFARPARELFSVIVIPLLLISGGAGLWWYFVGRNR